MARESVASTFMVALTLCLVCSLVVSTAATVLKDRIEQNKERDIQKNVLLAAGLADKTTSSSEIADIYTAKVSSIAIELGTADEVEVAASYDPKEARNKPEGKGSVKIEYDGPKPGLSKREQFAYVYMVKEGDEVQTYVLPIYGRGLWSTLYGFIAIDKDGKTVVGISFYEHKETPGLGGEVDNQKWKEQWIGKTIYDDAGEPAIELVKGSASNDNEVDALSGATITSNGVEDMVNYWLGPDGFGTYIESKTGGAPADAAATIDPSDNQLASE